MHFANPSQELDKYEATSDVVLPQELGPPESWLLYPQYCRVRASKYLGTLHLVLLTWAGASHLNLHSVTLHIFHLTSSPWDYHSFSSHPLTTYLS